MKDHTMNALINKAQPLSEKVYHQLLDRIITGTWLPGALYDRRSVARELGVSIAPVSEALIRLEKDGFIVTIPRKGTMLRPCDPRRLYENLILREAIECQAVRMAFGKLQTPTAMFKKLAVMADEADTHTRHRHDAAFHLALIQLSGIKTLADQLEHLQLQVVFDELIMLDNSPAVDDSHAQMLLDFAAAATPDVAEERMRRHLRSGREKLFQRYEQPELSPNKIKA